MMPCPQSAEGCAKWREGIIFNESTGKNEPFGACLNHLMVDHLQMMHRRIFALQAEMGILKNIVALQSLVELGLKDQNELVRVSQRFIEDSSKESPRLSDERI